jgi:glyceraldehyde 3-phosphate dehydrogenase
MKTRVAINGFGRIGRNVFKVLFERDDVEVVAINDLTDTPTLAYLLKHDTNYGTYHHVVESRDDKLVVNQQEITVTAQTDPSQLPWGDMNVDVVIESTGRFTKPEDAQLHIKAGAKKVIISAPAKGDGAHTLVYGANDESISEAGEVMSNASCTTNCISPVMAVMERHFGIEKAMMTTVHSYTASQVVQDAPAKDLREGRSAAENIVPTTTGAAIATGLVVPSLQGKFDGLSIRVPTPVVSLSDITMIVKRNTSVEEVNNVLKQAAAEPYYQGVLGVSDEPLVSSDYKGNSHSSIVDLALTNVVADNMVKVVAWYDNEWGYSNRLAELAADTGRMLHQDGGEKQESEEE